jgi:hypothetical protein
MILDRRFPMFLFLLLLSYGPLCIASYEEALLKTTKEVIRVNNIDKKVKIFLDKHVEEEYKYIIGNTFEATKILIEKKVEIKWTF